MHDLVILVTAVVAIPCLLGYAMSTLCGLQAKTIHPWLRFMKPDVSSRR